MTDENKMVTCMVEDSEGDMLCIYCKRAFGLIGTTNKVKIADANFCPHCGLRIVYKHELDQGVSLDELEMAEVCDA